MDISEERKQAIQRYYLQDEIVEEMVRVAKHREVAPTYPWGYGQRPDAVNFPGDFKNFVEQDAIAFHGSVEIWQNPHLIDTVADHNDIRTGWDLVIDIDCDHSIELSKITADAVVSEIESFGIDYVSVKFSGNRGFHIGVRREAFPDKVEGTAISDWYPDLPQTIVSFLRHRLRDQLTEQFLDQDPELEGVMETDGEGAPDPYTVCDIENNWGDRHLFRMPYSINEKSWLVSLPISRDQIRDFEKSWAEMDDITVEHRFLDTYEDGEATELVIEALDWQARNRDPDDESTTFDGEFDPPDDAIPEAYFPPTITNILDGLEDGRKRAVFILITFLAHCGYDWESIEQQIWEWNERNHEPLDESYITTQLNWHKRQDEPLMPPNWSSDGFYQDLGVYEEDPLTENVNNPVSYAFAKWNDDEADDTEERESGSGGSEKETVECPYCGKEYKGETKWYKDHVMACDG
jgi:hypothetical protein